MQKRHINNRQRAISFRQQFIEQLIESFRKIDRQVKADLQKEVDSNDKRVACFLRELEIVHARKIRELELYNNRSLVQKLIEDYSKDSVSEVQLTRLYELEQGLRHLDLEHNKLFRRVKRNECYCNKNKIKHNNQIIQIEENFEDYQREIKEYHETLNKSMADHREHLQVLNTKQELILRQQEKHEISINNLSLQRHNLEQLLR
ncbi:unnamed protein product, partial [Rotaria sp. Silwood2]